MRETPVRFHGHRRVGLEGVVSWPEGAGGPVPAVVVCPPHPHLTGDMEHPVVIALCRALDGCGMATLRWNYRGVGRSEGEFSNGESEPRDVEAALRLAQRWPGTDRRRLGVVGYSFGAAMVLEALGKLRAARAVALVSPPPAATARRVGGAGRRPVLVVAGSADRIAPPGRLESTLRQERARLHVVEGADHHWRGMEAMAAGPVARFLAGALS